MEAKNTPFFHKHDHHHPNCTQHHLLLQLPLFPLQNTSQAQKENVGHLDSRPGAQPSEAKVWSGHEEEAQVA